MQTPTEVPMDWKPQTMQVEYLNAEQANDDVETETDKHYDAAEHGIDRVAADGRDPSLHPDHPINAARPQQ